VTYTYSQHVLLQLQG